MPEQDHPYPTTYHAPFLARIKYASIVGPVYVLALFGRAHLDATSPVSIWIAAALGFLFLEAAALSIGFCSVTLYRDRIEKKSFFGKKVMRRDDVGKITDLHRGLIRLNYKYNSGDGMIMPKGIGGDAAWIGWMDLNNKL